MSTNLSPAKGNTVAQDASASPPYRFWLSVALLAATVMQVLDITIVSVALPYMAGSLSANTSQISWVVTSYLVAAAISTPLTGFLAARWGRRRLLLASLGGFVVVSGLCGVSQDLMEIVFLRLLQGLVGAPLPSLAQAMLIEAYPPEMRGRITARWSLAVVAGPILGPVIGGILVTHLDWRWVFYVNLPAGLLAWMLVYRFSSPSTTIEKRRIDLLGFASMAIGLGALQVVLDQGNTMGWFSSQRIVILTMLVVLTLSLFLWRALTRDDSIVHLRLLRNRDFGIASLASITFGAGFYGIVTYQPIFLEHLLGYPPETAGWISAARGITAMLGMLITGRLIHRTGPLVWALTGCVISAVGGYAMTGYDLHIGLSAALWPGILQGVGLGMAFTAIATLAFRSLPKTSTADAAGLFGVMRVLGGAIGVSLMATLLSHCTQSAWNHLGGFVTAFNPALHDYLDALPTSSLPAQFTLLQQVLLRHAEMQAYLNGFYALAAIFLLSTILLLIAIRFRGGATIRPGPRG
ncbi:DHA2 family efflux MFS transporter permease subunit [Acidithiobacillus thiooxidans]|uniref:DHA2 family efflux MFS transporter permease subunit n=1 Tax=Acidithiobacillus thiooxidans TaxID=930 RepID=UPI000824EAFF|nr:DHA2 family efflux MFS transporter permease subunit [Acidithiobacillus thiooxidans]OCX83651.1 hypothetical protein A6P08_10235 [Acidithiobacillus thiooxidans]